MPISQHEREQVLMQFEEMGLGFSRLKSDKRDTKSQRIIFTVGFNAMVIAVFCALAVGVRFVWIVVTTK